MNQLYEAIEEEWKKEEIEEFLYEKIAVNLAFKQNFLIKEKSLTTTLKSP